MALLPKIICVIQKERSICVTEYVKFNNIEYIKVLFGVNKQIYDIYKYAQTHTETYITYLK